MNDWRFNKLIQQFYDLGIVVALSIILLEVEVALAIYRSTYWRFKEDDVVA